MADVDFGDVLDMLARDYDTRAILMYVEGITQARKFMSAARGVARLKPVIVLKAGRHAAAAQAAASHTGAMAGSAAVYDAAFARAGLVLGDRAGRAVRRGRDAGPRPAAAQRAARHPDQRRRRRHRGDRPADRRGRRAGDAASAHHRAARQGDAAHLVARQSGRHRRRRRRRALCRRARHPGRRPRRRRGAGDERADRAHLVGGGRAGHRRRGRRARWSR